MYIILHIMYIILHIMYINKSALVQYCSSIDWFALWSTPDSARQVERMDAPFRPSFQSSLSAPASTLYTESNILSIILDRIVIAIVWLKYGTYIR